VQGRLPALAHGRRIPEWAWACAGFTVAFVAVTWPLAIRFTHATYGGPGDGWALIWQTRFRLDHGVSYFSPTFSTDIAWPIGAEYASSLLLSNAVTELPTMLFLLLGIGDVTAYNLIVFAAAVGSSLAMYACLRRLDCRPSVAFWGGLVYLLAPWHLEKLSIHPTLATMASLPLLLLAMVEWARSPDLRSGALVVAAAAVATYTHSYYGVAAAAFLLVATPLVLVAAWRRGIFHRTIRRTGLVALAVLAVPVPIALALLLQESQVATQLDRPLYDVAFTARPHLLLLPSPDNLVFGDFSRDYVSSRSLRANEGELALYVGFVTLLLALAGLGFAARGLVTRLGAALAAATALLGIALSLPTTVDLPLIGSVSTPSGILNDLLRFISTPTRFFALTLTGIVVLAGLGLEGVARRVGRPAGLALVLAVCILSAIELPFRRDGFVVDARPTDLVQLIEEVVPEGEAVAQYPSLTRDFSVIGNQLFYQLHHGRPVLNGAPAGSFEDGARFAVENKSDPNLGPKLALLGYRWATYDSKQGFQFGDSLETVRGFTPPSGIEIVKRVADGSVLMRVTARPAASLAGIATGFDRRDRWMTRGDATVLVCASAGGQHVLRFPAGAYARTRLFTLGNSSLQIVPAKGQIVNVRIPVRLRPGWQLLRFNLIGSKPVRPSDLFPGNIDTRPLVMSVGEISIAGPRGPARICSRPPADRRLLERPVE
jgi:6-pyruvoyl-tetrahydropterin synthase related domain